VGSWRAEGNPRSGKEGRVMRGSVCLVCVCVLKCYARSNAAENGEGIESTARAERRLARRYPWFR
jgi:hypothetical protein